ncbi:Asp-tRNA(Asn)/Glu-tRNA(Gln) amidotransferase subunit GatA [[Mycoplasma] testudinis]|uniref:Asp-tRNA(Asn)/Glu-tRNA(Gln) amidotransferase subunit GatA n=1 Tax=[Mycoplasma] testudinis TaxID=33924 RepID=UPI0004856D30|nr:Asp-tRNA(Asn)/Glu-tRNA(Gln) amidotransferase subunit GatA [[Mycoplasma] testudinis]
MQSFILELHEKLLNKKISAKKLVDKSLSSINKFKNTNFVLWKNSLEAIRLGKNLDTDSLLNGSFLAAIPYALKDNISTKHIVTTGGSKFLEHYVPPYDATVYKLLKEAGAILVAKTNLDEFGLGGTGSFSAYGVVSHPFKPKHIAGGSSSGSAVAVASGTVPFALGTDTGDSIRRPASLCGVVGYKPTYGLISRYGVFPYAPTFDHVGTFTRTIADAALVADRIIQYDPNDFTSQNINLKLFEALLEPAGNYKIAYPANLEIFMEDHILTAWNQLKSLLTKNKIELVPVELDLHLIQAIDPVYKILSYSEAASCYANLTGIPFGEQGSGENFEQKVMDARNKFFGDQLKRRFTIGAFATSKENFEKYYLKSKKVRAKIVAHINNILSQYDAFISLGASGFAPTIKDVLEDQVLPNIIDDCLQMANFGGLPSITLPFAKSNDNLDLGVNLTSKQFSDEKLLRIALLVETILGESGGFVRV